MAAFGRHHKKGVAASDRGISFVVSFVLAMNRINVVGLVDVDIDVDLVDVDLVDVGLVDVDLVVVGFVDVDRVDVDLVNVDLVDPLKVPCLFNRIKPRDCLRRLSFEESCRMH